MEHATFRLVAQSLNQLRHLMPQRALTYWLLSSTRDVFSAMYEVSFFLHREWIEIPLAPSLCCQRSSVLWINASVIGMASVSWGFNPLTPNDPYSGRTEPLTSKRCILYIYSTNTSTEYFKRCIYSPFFPLQNAVCFIILTYLVPVLFTFYIQGVLKFKKIIPAPKG